MARFIKQNLRFPIVLQFLSVAALVYLALSIFSLFVEKPKYEKAFVDLHAARTQPFVIDATRRLNNELQIHPGILPIETLNQLEVRRAIVEAAIIDCNADIYFSTNSWSTGTNFLKVDELNRHSSLMFLKKDLYHQAASTGVPISRNVNNSSRYQLNPLPCVSKKNSQYDHAFLFTYLDWSDLVAQDLAMIEKITWDERAKWLILISLTAAIMALFLTPRISRLKKVIATSTSGDYTHKYGKGELDELDTIGQSFDKLLINFRTKIDETEQAGVEYALGYAAFKKGVQAVCICSADQRIIDINEVYETQTGYTREETAGRSLRSILPEEFLASGAANSGDILKCDLLDGSETEAWGIKKDGARYRKAFRIFSQRDSRNNIEYLFYVERDITQEFEQREKLELLAKTDPLTDIYNRRRFELDLATALSVSQKRLAIGIINVDSMREINSEYGKSTGDSVIVESSRRLALSMLGTRNNVYRFEGDEFYILFRDFESEQELERYARTILSSLVGGFSYSGTTIEITAGIGVAIFDDSTAKDTNMVLDHANLALRHAKTIGRSKIILANDKVLSAQRRALSISLALKSSKLTDHLRISYLPKIDIEHGILAGAEAIISCEFPQIDSVTKEEWLSIAEKTGDIARIDEWAIECALKDTVAFTKQISGFQTSIRISSCRLNKPSFANDLIHKIKSAGIPSDCIALELTEHSLIESKEMSIPTIKKLRKAGISIHIEDFGIGYSSSRDLTDLPFDALKINKIFLDKKPNLQVINTVFSVARSMNVPVIAEGVQSTYHLNLLKQMGCEFCLGYLYSEPVVLEKDTEPQSILSYWQKSIETVMP